MLVELGSTGIDETIIIVITIMNMYTLHFLLLATPSGYTPISSRKLIEARKGVAEY